MQAISCLAALAIGMLVGCASARMPAVPAQDSVKVELLPPAADLSGSWATGSGGEPPAGPIVKRPSCAYNPAVWIIEQSGNTLKTWLIPESYNQGIARAGAGAVSNVASPGTISGTEVRVDYGGAPQLLRYEPASGHLVGTRNGVPFWAARQKILRTEACPGIPNG